MNISKITKALMCTVALSSFSAQAADENFYVQLNGGAALGMAPKGDFGTKKAGTSGLVGIEAGYQFNEHFRAGVSLDYMTGFSFKDHEVEDGDSVTTKWKIKSLVAMVNGYFDIADVNGFAPYITLGLGVARNQASGIYSLDGTALSEKIPNDKKINFAYKAGFGTRYSISEDIAFDARYQFVNLGKIKSGSNDNFNNHHGKLHAHQFLIGVAYKF